MKRILLAVSLLLFVTGCFDERIKREASLLNTATIVAAKEFSAATDDKKKIEIARNYFQDAPAMTQVLEDYLYARQPAPAPVVQPLPAPVAQPTAPAPAK